MAKIRVGINGLGRIGRAFLKIASLRPELEIVAVNDLGEVENFAYLLKYDSVYGKNDSEVSTAKESDKQFLIYENAKILFLSEKDPANLPWKDLAIDVIVESTGFFASTEKAQAHIKSGAKRVVITAPIKDDESPTVLLGINEEKLNSCLVSSNASCTTNSVSPVLAILDEALGVEKALLNTVHGYTASQALVDGPSKRGFREGRAGAENIVPSSTGAAIAVTKALPQLSGKFDGISIRVPVPCGSIVDVTFISKKSTTAEEVNEILRGAAKAPRWSGIFSVTDEELVSSDILGSPFASIADLSLTRVVDGTLVKVMAWYDNEMGYTHTLVKHVLDAGKHI